jgi:DNA-directed RNA polymerase subunit E'/Rpb7
MTLTIARKSTSHGNSTATPQLRWVYDRANNLIWNTGVYFARGTKKTITISEVVRNRIINGSLTELQTFAEKSSNDYAFFDTISIAVKCEKKKPE